jgi:hypothetical protein
MLQIRGEDFLLLVLQIGEIRRRQLLRLQDGARGDGATAHLGSG